MWPQDRAGSSQYLVLCLLSQLVLELLELLRGVAAQLLVGLLQSTELSGNLLLLRLGKPAKGRGNLSGNPHSPAPWNYRALLVKGKTKPTTSAPSPLPGSAKSSTGQYAEQRLSQYEL